MELKIPKPLIKVTGDITLSPWPMFVQYKPYHYKIGGELVDLIVNTVQPGDIVLRRYTRYLNTVFTPGYWGHASLYASNNRIIHATSKGVNPEHIRTFCRTDSLCIRRINCLEPEIVVERAIDFAEKIVGKEYDFGFVIGDDKYSCAEVVNTCYKPLFANDYEKVYGKISITRKEGIKFSQWVITPGGLYRSKAADTILEIRKGKIIELDEL